jgi:hypothetical protein
MYPPDDLLARIQANPWTSLRLAIMDPELNRWHDLWVTKPAFEAAGRILDARHRGYAWQEADVQTVHRIAGHYQPIARDAVNHFLTQVDSCVRHVLTDGLDLEFEMPELITEMANQQKNPAHFYEALDRKLAEEKP